MYALRSSSILVVPAIGAGRPNLLHFIRVDDFTSCVANGELAHAALTPSNGLEAVSKVRENVNFLAAPPFDFAQDLAREWRRHEGAIDHEARVLASRMARTQAFLRQSRSHDTRVSTNE